MTLHIRDNHISACGVCSGYRPGRCARLLKLHPQVYVYKQTLHPSLCLTPWRTQTHTRSEYETRFITIKVSPKGIETHRLFRVQP